MIHQQIVAPIHIHHHWTTTNMSFLDMHYYLKQKGIKNNKFMLALYDSDLDGVDPRDPRLNRQMKLKVLRECRNNFWYFIREVVRIPDQGGTVGGGIRYKLHRGNMAMNYGFLCNWNMFIELPRQHGKTISADCWYLWVYNFGTTNTEMMFMNKKHDDSRMNLRRLRDIRDTLPEYLQMSAKYNDKGEKLKVSNPVDSAKNFNNNNIITTKPSAKTRNLANSLGRGCTMPAQWYDEYAFIPYNYLVYAAATPAFKTASDNAKRNGAPYGILITTTPGDTTTDEGIDARDTKDNATPFREEYYDYTMQELEELKATNTNSSFFYMRFTYKQLGSGEQYFKDMVIDLKRNWAAIRREVLLEWADTTENSPFKQQDLDIVETLIREPIGNINVGKYYFVNLYKQVDIYKYPPIIGVDVSGGYKKDSSAISVIDSKTTDLIADFNCNYVAPHDLAKVIYELVMTYMPNAVVNVERTGGYGASVLGMLIKSKIKRNLYYEIKERVMEESFNGVRLTKKTNKVKVYGYDETKANRELLMQILRDRMDNHKAKFISPILFNELKTLEVKKNGRIEHANNAHDDQIFAYLLALYVWYEGKNVMENFGLEKGTISTDEDQEAEFGLSETYDDLSDEMIMDAPGEDMVRDQLEYLQSDTTIPYKTWLEQEYKKDQASMNSLLDTKLGRKAYSKKFHMSEEDINTSPIFKIPDSVFNVTDDDINEYESEILSQFKSMTNVR